MMVDYITTRLTISKLKTEGKKMDNTATVIFGIVRIRWIVKHNGQKFEGADTLSSLPGRDYSVLLSNVVNDLQRRFGLLDFDFIRE